MKINELQNFTTNYKMGTYTKAKWKSESVVNGDTFTKITESVVRFISYGSVKITTTTNNKPNTNKVEIIKNVCYYNKNTNNLLVHLYTTKNPNQRTKTTYYCNGVEISKSEYESNVKVNGGKVDLMFAKKLQDIISLG